MNGSSFFAPHVLFEGKLINSFLNIPINIYSWTDEYFGDLISWYGLKKLAVFQLCEIFRKQLEAKLIFIIFNVFQFRLLFDRELHIRIA